MKRTYLDKNKINELKNEENLPLEFDETAEEPIVIVAKEELFRCMEILKKKYMFHMLSCITAVDYKDRVEIVYDLVNRKENCTLMIKAILDKQSPSIASMTSLWSEANFQEREQYDLVGVEFTNHPDLRRILLPEDFVGYPLRKDFKNSPENVMLSRRSEEL